MSEFNFQGEISGAGNVFGDNASVHNGNNDFRQGADLSRLVDVLIREVALHRAELHEAERLTRLASVAAAYAAEPQPNADGIRSLLPALTAGAGTVTAVADAVLRISQAVNAL
ncbi:hypothetical protein V6V47_07000 [Micromonospora sp. CPCC 205539]|uniref:hypothetical protein n=1 Tax=Micromonospora sp. CPCC 205539 TaxID=3122408 RepID=UPI002FEF5107